MGWSRVAPKPANLFVDARLLTPPARYRGRLDGLTPPGQRQGIAWDPDTRRLFVTGKLWPELFEIEVVPHPTLTLDEARERCIPRSSYFCNKASMLRWPASVPERGPFGFSVKEGRPDGRAGGRMVGVAHVGSRATRDGRNHTIVGFFSPDTTRLGANGPVFARSRPKFGRLRAKFGRNGADFGPPRIGTNSAEFSSKSTEFGLISTELAGFGFGLISTELD